MFSKYPNPDALLVNFVQSTLKEHGIQALIVMSLDSSGVAGLPTPALPRHVYLQVTARGGGFVKFDEAPNACVITLDMYLSLLQFFVEDYPRIESKMRHELLAMREKQKTVLIEPGIGFVGHGYCIYQHRLDNETVLEIRTESKTKDDIFYIHLLKNNQSLPLYGNAMKTLANNLPTLKKLTQSSDGR